MPLVIRKAPNLDFHRILCTDLGSHVSQGSVITALSVHVTRKQGADPRAGDEEVKEQWGECENT